MIPGTGSMPRKEASEETSNSASKGVPGLEERNAIMMIFEKKEVVKEMETNKI